MPAGDHSRLVGAQIDRFRRVAVQLEGNLLQVEDDVGGVLDHAGDRLELVQHAFDLDRGDRSAFDRTQQHAPQRIANGGAKAAFKRLCPEVTVLVGQGVGVDRQTFRFLKTFPKHLLLLLLRPCCSGDTHWPEGGFQVAQADRAPEWAQKLSSVTRRPSPLPGMFPLETGNA